MAGGGETVIYPSDITLVQAQPDDPVTISVGNDTLRYGSTTSLGSSLTAGQSITRTAATYIRTDADGVVLLKTYDPWDRPDNVGADELSDAALQAITADLGIPVSVMDFGAVGDGVTDDTAAIQAAIDSLPQPADFQSQAERFLGGTVVFPYGKYKCAGELDLDDKVGINLVGQSGRGGYSYRSGSLIRYTGTGSDPFLSMKSSANCRLADLAVQYTSASFTGNLIDFSQSASLSDAGTFVIERCMLGGDGVNTAACVISLKKAIIGTIRDCDISWAQLGVSGDPDSGGAYSNAHTIDNCQFNNLREGALHEAGEEWVVINPICEGTVGAVGSGMKRFYFQEDTGSTLHSMTVIGGWFGDGTDVTNWIETAGTFNLRIFGGVYSMASSGTTAFKLNGPGQLCIQGAGISGEHAIDLDATPASNGKQGVIMGCNFGTTDTPIVNRAGHNGLTIVGNKDTFGRRKDTLYVEGPLVFGDQDTDPSIAAGAAAGSSPTVAIAGSDQTGRISITTGTSATTGILATVTFRTAYDAALIDVQDKPKVMLSPRNAKSSAAPVYLNNNAAASFEIKVDSALDDATAYAWDYLIIQ